MQKNIAAGLLALLLSTGTAVAETAVACDRPCLEDLVNSVLASMKAHDASTLPLAANVRFTENGVELKPGEGLWWTFTDVTDYRILAADPKAGDVAFMGLVKEAGQPLYYALRLKVRNQQITEIEAIAARQPNFSEPAPGQVRNGFGDILPPAEWVSRAELERIALGYFDALVQGNSKLTRFAGDCLRIENGVITAGYTGPADGSPFDAIRSQSCKAQADSGFMSNAPVDQRRVWVIDEERGILFGLFRFQGKGQPRPAVTGGPMRDAAPGSAQIAEIFRIKGGKIDLIEAIFGGRLPYGYSSGW